ncbi:formate dehydrogenase subunit alpha [Pseudonocardia sulfidoxydans NBRC 16205]|uniref:Formate dehydrogenase subunit alpha n=1 Tax=Pseudonocardia sulfidoxydans NBRC 16205 TaxID=1223511 RepID=A0A511D985_9PSEU|nr:formate dehydrogenase subunit alpha [Pseudonocardia sulfidoxydans NBRC 16205]
MFGAGGGTSAYVEAEDADLLVLWGSNARETHPIFFHHVLQGLRKGTRMYSVDPRRTSTARWADGWLGLDVGTDIALANAIGREIIHADLVNHAFVDRATTGFADYAESVEPYTLERAAQITGVDAALIEELAHAYARADRAQICWTLGITEHHNAADYVFALINLALLTGHVGRYGSGLVPLRGQNNVQGGGDMGSIPAKLPGGYDLGDDEARARFEATWGAPISPKAGMHLSQMFEAMEAGTLKALYCIGENPAESEANAAHARHLLEGLDHLVVQDIFRTATAELADVVLPAAADWCEYEGTVTNSERRVQRVRKAIEPPGQARPDTHIICAVADRLGHDWGEPTAEQVWDELRSLSLDWHHGMSYARLEEHGGLQWPCPTEDHPGTPLMHARLWAEDPAEIGTPAPFTPVEHVPPVDVLDEDFPIRLTTVRLLDAYNSGVQSGGYSSPMRRRESLRMDRDDAARLGIADGERVRVVSRRGAVEAPVALDPSLRPGLASFTPHFSEEVDTNVLTNDAWDPKSGTSEFKATAIRIEKLADAPRLATAGD